MFERLRFKRLTRKDERKTFTSSEATAASSGTSELMPSSYGYSRSPSPSPSGLGLRVIHQPAFASLDIIFVHGLGGHSQQTWSKDHDPSLFWPELWLPSEPDVGMARIMTFGYNANFRGIGAKSISNIMDFAKELLWEMRFAKDESGTDLNVGTNPLMFVVHSMGGLVVKKAYLLGIHDEMFKHIISAISAIIFLSTPHRGTNLAETLNRVLAASFQTPKSFISDLSKSSPAIQELNEQFRHLAPRLSICSFYETLATSIGPKKIMVLEKDSSVLGYPSEISRPLQADHHEVCKFASAADPNYISVRNAIKSLVGMAKSKAKREAIVSNSLETTDLQELFRNCQTSEADFNTLRRYWIQGSCGWFLQQPEVEQWIHSSSEPSILWCTAPPASGKSILSAFIIHHLKSVGRSCHYFIFKYSDHSKRSVANCLQALAFQTAKDIPEFRKLLSQSSPSALELESSDITLLWVNLFEKLLFQTGYESPIYWIFDALDECDSPKALLECLGSLSSAAIPIHVLIVSRSVEAISVTLDRLSYNTQVSHIDISSRGRTGEDIELFVTREVKHLRGSDEFKDDLKRSVIARSNGNFLWTRLVLDEIRDCHTEESTREVLEAMPDDMAQLYHRMESTMIGTKRKSTQVLVKTLFEWALCAQRPLTLKELSHALKPEFSGILDLQRTITETCGQFVVVDEASRIGILHHTAREYLTRNTQSSFHVNTRATHEKLCLKTLSILIEPDLRWKLMQSQHALQTSEPFIFYASAHWLFHLGHSHSSNSGVLDLLVEFLHGFGVLTWIHALALLRRLDLVVKAAKVLESFVRNMRKQNQLKNPLRHRLSDLDLVEAWIVDLIKITGKFGQHIISEPSIIYDVVPALSPRKSALHGQYYNEDSALIKIHGTDECGWTDHLGCLALPPNTHAWKVSCAARIVAILSSTGTIHIWDSSNFTEVITVWHGEPVTAMALNNNGARLATYGLRTTKVWSIPSGKLLLVTSSPVNAKAMAIAFAANDSKLIMGGDDNVIRYVHCEKFNQGWQIMNENLLGGTGRIEGAVANSPMCLAFNGDNTQVGVSYRGAPLSVWNIKNARCINRCKRAKTFQSDQRRPSQSWFAVDRFTWNPVTGHILGIYKDGCIFKWHPLTEENIEAQCASDEIAASPNGKLFAVSSSNGSVSVWSFAYFSVIYQLSSEDLVTGLAFSPENRRFYDIRGSVINAWESNSIARFFENEENASDTNSEDQSSTAISKFSEEWVPQFEAVTAFAPAPDGETYCVGYQDGNVMLFDRSTTEGAEITRFHNFLDVTHIVWSHDGRYLALADLAGDIKVLSMPIDHDQIPRNNSTIQEFVGPQLQLNGYNIEQMLFNFSGELLLTLTSSNGFLCSVEDGTVRTTCDLGGEIRRKWIRHPTRHDILLAFGPTDIQAYSWKDLSKIFTSSYHKLQQRPRLSSKANNQNSERHNVTLTQLSFQETDSTSLECTAAFLTQDSEHILINIRDNTVGRAITTQIMIFQTADFEPVESLKSMPSSFGFSQLPEDISAQVSVPLGVLRNNEIVFLDHDLWVTSYVLEAPYNDGSAGSSRRLYFIPRDWVGAVSLRTCSLTLQRTLFWPKADRVLLIEGGVDETNDRTW